MDYLVKKEKRSLPVIMILMMLLAKLSFNLQTVLSAHEKKYILQFVFRLIDQGSFFSVALPSIFYSPFSLSSPLSSVRSGERK